MITEVPTLVTATCASMVHLGSTRVEAGPHGPCVVFMPHRPLATNRTETLKNVGFVRTPKVYKRNIYKTPWGTELIHEAWTWTTPKPSPYT